MAVLEAFQTTMLAKNKGAFAEHLAISWLLKQGYEVFANVSQHGAADLIILKEDEITKVDVKTEAVVNSSAGNLHFRYNNNSPIVRRKELEGVKVLTVNPVTNSCNWVNAGILREPPQGCAHEEGEQFG